MGGGMFCCLVIKFLILFPLRILSMPSIAKPITHGGQLTKTNHTQGKVTGEESNHAHAEATGRESNHPFE
ncbi:Uncharacterized protein TCM_003863 [Theobroma cacao]|uniref:Secreted protein n=1 Tax=Theobroma cacao TaxID=3641 RepID=A0A061DWA6_THECC|nr:Uncharacterized protein TCM_003863 [Theobroma cacao]